VRTLADLQCAETEDKIAWMRFHRQTRKMDQPSVQVAFCADCVEDSDFRREAVENGTCIKVKP
jgi:hypothetical protein